MGEKIKTSPQWLNEVDNKSFWNLMKLWDTQKIRDAISNDFWLKKNIETQYKNDNQRVLSRYWTYWVNMTSMNEALKAYWFRIEGNTSDFWVDSFMAICSLQKVLWMKVDWLLDLQLLQLIFPRTFRTLNKKQWRTPEETNKYLLDRLVWYNNFIETEEKQINEETKRNISELKNELEQSKTLLKDKQKDKKTKNSKKDEPDNENNTSKKVKKIEIGNIKIISLPPEKVWKKTQCSKVARKNMYRLWVPKEEIPQWPTAIDSMRLYWEQENYVNKLTNLPDQANVLDLFVDTRSKEEHRAVAYLENWNWMVLDPFIKLNSNKTNVRLPVPLEEYISSQKLLWVYPHVV